jgi:hypothetical protein
MRDTATPPTSPDSACHVGLMNDSVRDIYDVEIAQLDSADAEGAAFIVVAMIVVAMALRPGIS